MATVAPRWDTLAADDAATEIQYNSAQAKELIAAGFKKDYKPKCLSMWNPGGLGVQNIDTKEAGADAMATYLRALGLNAYSGSRLD